MVVRTRLRSILYPLCFYAISGVVSAYFVHTALHGDRGLRTKDEYQRQIASLRTDLIGLQVEHEHWQHRVTLMRSAALDNDLAAEQARLKLDYVDARDLVIFTDPHRLR